MSPDAILLRGASIFDALGQPPFDGDVVIEHDRIAAVRPGGRSGRWDGLSVECRGRSVLPGLIDAHVHAGAVEIDIPRQHREYSTSLIALHMARRITAMLDLGFTTVRDAGGTDAGFRTAIEQGVIRGPRLLVSGRPLSQTGGHGDDRTPNQFDNSADGHRIDMTKVIADGCDELVRAVREELRRGSDQIKLMASGGVLSQSDVLERTQFTPDEVRAVVHEAHRAGSYVLAHAYTPDAIRQCVDAGVRSIEHANFLDHETAVLMREAGAFMVPTLIVHEVLDRFEGGALSDAEKVKLARVRAAGRAGMRVAAEVGVKIASGSDLMGPYLASMPAELALKAHVLGSVGALIASTRTNAELLGLDGEVGSIAVGMRADLLVVDGDVARDVALLEDPARLHAVFQGGVLTAGTGDGIGIERRP